VALGVPEPYDKALEAAMAEMSVDVIQVPKGGLEGV
jgi:hypothetical protein